MCKGKKKSYLHDDRFVNSCKQANMTFSFQFHIFFLFSFLSQSVPRPSPSYILRRKKNPSKKF
jgi:hypothetical protein